MNNQWVRHQYCHAVLNMSASNTLKSKLFTPTLADYYVFLIYVGLMFNRSYVLMREQIIHCKCVIRLNKPESDLP